MNRSTNYNFYLPENSDYRDVSQFVYNFETIDSAMYPIVFGSSSKTVAANLDDSWEVSVPNDGLPHLCKISAQYGAVFGYITRYSTNYGVASLSRYDGHTYLYYLNNGTVTQGEADPAKTTTNLSAYDNRVTWSDDRPKIIKCGNVCVLTGLIQYQMTPTSNQTSVLVIPTGMVPDVSVFGVCLRSSDKKPFVLQASTSGNINIINGGSISSGDSVYIGLTWIV